MADKDAVEPADESTPAEPTSGDAGGRSGSHALGRKPAGDDAERVDGPAADEPVAMSDEEFDEIIRNAGVEDDDLPSDDDSNDGDTDSSKVLEPAGVAAAGAGTAAKKPRPVRSPKDAPTGKRDQVEKRERTTPPKFVRQSIGELRKVVYPTGQQLLNYFVVVLVFVLFVIAYVSLLDLGMGAAIFKVFS